MLNFTSELAREIFSYDDPYPIYLDDAWQWLGYKDIASAKKHLERLSEMWDYRYTWSPKGREHAYIVLSTSGFMSLAALADTDSARDARKCFVECLQRSRQERYAELGNPK